jgi:hypothetical protein
MKAPLYFTVTLDDDVKNEADLNNLTYEVNQIINHPRGWKAKGVHFRYVHPRFISSSQQLLHIRFSSPRTIRQHCPNIEDPWERELSPNGMSCASQSERLILINMSNWNRPPQASLMGKSQYHSYCILHEVGHILGHGHRDWPEKRTDTCNIMNQQTLNNHRCRPFPFVL